MSDIVKRLRAEHDTLLAFGQDWSDLLLPAVAEIERLRAENLYLRKTSSGRPSAELFEAATAELREALRKAEQRELVALAEIDEFRARIAELEVEAATLAANQCHHGYAAENGDHRCKYEDQIVKLKCKLHEYDRSSNICGAEF